MSLRTSFAENVAKLNRYELFTFLINDLQLKRGVEVGVREGDFSCHILKTTNIGYLFGIDIKQHEKTKEIFRLYPNRYSLLIERSPNIADKFTDEYFDFVHIDAGHSYNDVKNDIEAWYPKLKFGGIFSGDDYCSLLNPTEGLYGIVEAVEEFVDKNKINNLYITEIGLQNKNYRIDYAKRIGKMIEDNLFLIHDYMLPKHLLVGRKRTENVEIPNWWFVKQ